MPPIFKSATTVNLSKRSASIKPDHLTTVISIALICPDHPTTFILMVKHPLGPVKRIQRGHLRAGQVLALVQLRYGSTSDFRQEIMSL